MRKNILALLVWVFCFGSEGQCSDSPVINQILNSTEYARDSVKSIILLREKGGRIDWSPSGDSVLIDQKGLDGYYDIYQMQTDGSGEKCLTCDTGGILSTGHNGQPVWHPSGDFFVFQSQKKQDTGRWGRDLAAQPGLGRYCDLWLMYLQSGKLIHLTHTENTDKTGVLHPHFSKDGKKLTWSEMYSAKNWRVMVADFSLNNGIPRLSTIQMSATGSGKSFAGKYSVNGGKKRIGPFSNGCSYYVAGKGTFRLAAIGNDVSSNAGNNFDVQFTCSDSKGAAGYAWAVAEADCLSSTGSISSCSSWHGFSYQKKVTTTQGTTIKNRIPETEYVVGCIGFNAGGTPLIATGTFTLDTL